MIYYTKRQVLSLGNTVNYNENSNKIYCKERLQVIGHRKVYILSKKKDAHDIVVSVCLSNYRRSDRGGKIIYIKFHTKKIKVRR